MKVEIIISKPDIDLETGEEAKYFICYRRD